MRTHVQYRRSLILYCNPLSVVQNSATWSHLAQVKTSTDCSKVMPHETAVELQHSFNAAVRTGIMELPISTKESRSCVPFPSGGKRSIHNARRAPTLLPADVRLKVSEAGSARVVDRRSGHFPGKQQNKERHPPPGTQYLKYGSRITLAQKLRALASGLEKEPDRCLEALLREVEVSVKELRDRVWRAEQRALTTGFYGQPPRVTME
jgi:hypothetical protein